MLVPLTGVYFSRCFPLDLAEGAGSTITVEIRFEGGPDVLVRLEGCVLSIDFTGLELEGGVFVDILNEIKTIFISASENGRSLWTTNTNIT